jgi:hypothetical protein
LAALGTAVSRRILHGPERLALAGFVGLPGNPSRE